MRALLTGGIKAILAIAALSTAAHWALRVQRDAPSPVPAMAALPDPVTTGSIEPRRIERQPERPVAAAGPSGAAALDQNHLAALIAGATQQKPKAAKAGDPAKTAAVKTAAVKTAAVRTAIAEKPVEKPVAKR